jgi:hypothetical protein
MHVVIMAGTDGEVFRYITLTEGGREVCLLFLKSEEFTFNNIPVAGFKMSHSRSVIRSATGND